MGALSFQDRFNAEKAKMALAFGHAAATNAAIGRLLHVSESAVMKWGRGEREPAKGYREAILEKLANWRPNQ